MQTEFDVLIIGAGPAGSSAAALLHQQGFKLLVVEKQIFPRFVIGESLLPHCMDLLKEADLLNAVEAQRFIHKCGAAFFRGSETCNFDFSEQTHITPQDIAAEVQSYKMKETSGLGLVFIVDRLVHRYQPSTPNSHGMAATHAQSNAGAVYIVFFDIATRSVISAKREVHGVASGGNFRNFWFGPIKDTERTLGKYRAAEASMPAN